MSRPSSSFPTVSVVIPAYNAAQFITEAVDSVLAQTYKGYEIIVVNDGSPDTPALERRLTPYGDLIRYIKQQNKGPSGARNTAIKASRGEYIGFLDSDDKWLPDLLNSQLSLINSSLGFDLVYADEILFGDTPLEGQTTMQHYPSRGAVTFESLLEDRCVVNTSTVLARRRSLMEVGLFNEAYRCSEDFDLWLRLAHKGARFAYGRRVLACHREHAASVTAPPERVLEAQVLVLEQLSGAIDLSATQRGLLETRVARCRAQLAVQCGKRFLLRGQYKRARRAVEEADNYSRSGKLKLVRFGLLVAPGVLRFALSRRHSSRSGGGVLT